MGRHDLELHGSTASVEDKLTSRNGASAHPLSLALCDRDVSNQAHERWYCAESGVLQRLHHHRSRHVFVTTSAAAVHGMRHPGSLRARCCTPAPDVQLLRPPLLIWKACAGGRHHLVQKQCVAAWDPGQDCLMSVHSAPWLWPACTNESVVQ